MWSKCLEVCPSTALVVEGRGTLVVFAAMAHNGSDGTTRYTLDGAEPHRREGRAFIWDLDGPATLTSNACFDTFVFLSRKEAKEAPAPFWKPELHW